MPGKIIEGKIFEKLLVQLRKDSHAAVKSSSLKLVFPNDQEDVFFDNAFDAEQLVRIIALIGTFSEISYTLRLGGTELTDRVYHVVGSTHNLKEMVVSYPLGQEDFDKANKMLLQRVKVSSVLKLETTHQEEIEGEIFNLSSSASIPSINSFTNEFDVHLVDLIKITKALKKTKDAMQGILKTNVHLAKQIHPIISDFLAKPKKLLSETFLFDLDEKIRPFVEDIYGMPGFNPQYSTSLMDGYTERCDLLKGMYKGIQVDAEKYKNWKDLLINLHQKAIELHKNSEKNIEDKIKFQMELDCFIMIFSDFISLNEGDFHVKKAHHSNQELSLPDEEKKKLRNMQQELLTLVSPTYKVARLIFNGTNLNILNMDTGLFCSQSQLNLHVLMRLLSLSLTVFLHDKSSLIEEPVRQANDAMMNIVKNAIELNNVQSAKDNRFDSTITYASLNENFGEIYNAMLHYLNKVSPILRAFKYDTEFNDKLLNLYQVFQKKKSCDEMRNYIQDNFLALDDTKISPEMKFNVRLFLVTIANMHSESDQNIDQAEVDLKDWIKHNMLPTVKASPSHKERRATPSPSTQIGPFFSESLTGDSDKRGKSEESQKADVATEQTQTAPHMG